MGTVAAHAARWFPRFLRLADGELLDLPSRPN